FFILYLCFHHDLHSFPTRRSSDLDGAFKDPVGKIWELADPVVSPAYTKGLAGQPNEIKLKYLADNNFSHLRGDELKAAIAEFMKERKDVEESDTVEDNRTNPR